MKCGIITFHRAINYGAVLQTYALQQALKNLNAESEVIDYRCKSIESLYRPSFIDRLSKKYIKRIVAAILKNGTIKFNTKGFEEFSRNYLKISDRKYSSSKELKTSDYDVYITGSDQVWSYYCAGFDKAYFLDFVQDSKKKNSYAASFGVSEIPDQLKAEYKELLEDFQNISVREKSGMDILHQVVKRNSIVVPDPTILLTKKQWLNVVPQERVIKDEYILIYVLEKDMNIIRFGIELGQKYNLKVAYITSAIRDTEGVINLRKISPEQWLNLVYNAKYVLTNSFHGMVFSTMFEKQFCIQGLKKNCKVNSRINDFAKMYDLMDRMDYTCVDDPIDYGKVAAKLEEERNKGYSYLKNILGE